MSSMRPESKNRIFPSCPKTSWPNSKTISIRMSRLEVLKKLLNDELKVRAKRNLVQSRSLMEMLENAIKKYHNKILTAAEVMEELIKISKEIVASDKEADKLNLSDLSMPSTLRLPVTRVRAS
jgi:type I site-specific restriction-modification system R (restriction) subunit